MLKQPKLLWIGGVLILAALSRLLPHPDNFAAIGAMALFGGATLGKRPWGLVLPLLALLMGDLLLMNRSTAYGEYIFGPGFIPVYGSFLVYYLIGTWTARNKAVAVGAGSVLGSMFFFIVTNFFVWYGGTMYNHDFAGLITCYIAALPFYWNTLGGDLFFSLILFWSLALAERYVPAFKKA